MEQPLISEIQTTALYYYDSAFGEQCRQFCLLRDIDYLPSLEDARTAYQCDKAGARFVEKTIGGRQMISGRLRLFDPRLLDRFLQQPLLFVFTDGYLTGVVHYSDYNRPEVSIYLYRLFFDYEKALRILLSLNRLSNRDIKAWYEQRLEAACSQEEKSRLKRRLHPFNKKGLDLLEAPRLDTFYLDDLVNLATDKYSIPLSGDVAMLRNSVMHVHDHVERRKGQAQDGNIYDLDSFTVFFSRCLALHVDLKRVRNRVLYLQNGAGADGLPTGGAIPSSHTLELSSLES